MSDYYLPMDGSPFTTDITFCTSEGCPFTDCQRHRENLDAQRKWMQPIIVSMSDFRDLCEKYKSRDKTCESCRWRDGWFGTCCNGDSPYRADVTGEGTSCAYWEPFTGREKIRKEVEEQFG